MYPKQTTAIIALFALLSTAPVLFAQQGGQPAEGYAGQQGAQQADVDAATVDKVANALVEVTSIQQDFTQQLEGVKGDEQARELQTEAQEKMVAAVQQAGLSVGEYNHVVELMNQNPVLRQQVMERAESIQ